MAGPLAYYPLSRKTADPFGNLAPQSTQVINCLFDATQAAVDPSNAANRRLPYPNTGTEVDYGIRDGELVFTHRGTLGYQHPRVRAALNNISVEAVDDQAALGEIRDSIVVVGFSTKTCSVNTLNINHTEPPVAAVAGSITVLNVCQYTTIPGDTLIWCLPTTTRGSQTPLDGSSAMSPLRRFLEPVPLRVLIDPFCKRRLNQTLTGDELQNSKLLFPDHDLASFGLERAFRDFLLCVGTHLAVYNEIADNNDADAAGVAARLLNVRAARAQVANRGDAGGLYNPAGPAAVPPPPDRYQTAFTTQSSLSSALINMLVVTENNGVAQTPRPTAALEHIVAMLIPLVGVVNQMLSSRRVAHVMRGAVPGKRHDISIQMGPGGATKRLHSGF